MNLECLANGMTQPGQLLRVVFFTLILSFATAARLWTAFGHPREAAAVRAQARQVLSGSPEPIVKR